MFKNRLRLFHDRTFVSLIIDTSEIQKLNVMETKTEIRNKVQLMGSINKAPIVKETNNGKKMAMFSIATTDWFFKDGEKTSETQWHFAKAWGKVAEELETNFTRGLKVSVNGKLSSRSYIDKKGEKKYITEVVVLELEIINKA
jgi:single-strand DNA-binding protein